MIARFLRPDSFANHFASKEAGATPHWQRGFNEGNESSVVVVVVVVVVVLVVVEVVGLIVIGADVGVAGVVVGLAGRDGLFGRALHTTLQVQPSVLPTFKLYFLSELHVFLFVFLFCLSFMFFVLTWLSLFYVFFVFLVCFFILLPTCRPDSRDLNTSFTVLLPENWKAQKVN